MKKNLLFTIFTLCCFTIGFSQADCANALTLTPGVSQSGDSAGQPGDFDAGGAAPTNPCDANYNDDEYWFEYTAGATGETLQLDVSNLTNTWQGLFVLDDCPSGTPTCIASHENGSSSADFQVITPNLTAGTSYKIVITAWGTPDNTAFTLDSTVIPPLTCTSTVVDSSTVVDDCPNSQFTVDVVVSTVGDGTVINDGTNTYPVVAGTVTAGPYAVGDVVTLTAEHSDSACDFDIGTFSSACPPPNDECVDAITIACGGQYLGDTTAATAETPDPGTCGTTAGTGGAVWYTFVGANSNDAGAAVGTVGDDVTLDLSASTFDTKIRVFEGTCGALVCVDGDDDGGTGTTSLLTLPGTLVGTTYYVLVHGYNANVGAYTMDVTCTPPPLCSTAVVDSSTIVDSCNPDGTGTFTIDHVVSVAGDAGTVFNDGTNTYPLVVGTVTTGPYNSGDSITIEVEGTDPACDFTLGTFDYTCPQPPPANDDCANAISLTPGAVFTDNPVTGQTNVGATDSGEMPLPGCATYDPADASGNGGDVWYSVTVPSDGNLTIETDADPTGGGGDGGMAVYTGSCGSLALLECNDDGGPGLYGQVIIEPADALADQVVYVRVWEFGGDAVIDFQVSAFSATLGIDDVENSAAFTYYPNPVQNTLTLSAQNTIENVTMYNMLGQEVLRANPNNVNSELDMSSLQDGTYFVKVTIANITKTVRVIKQ